MVSQTTSPNYASAFEDDARILDRYDLDTLTDSPQRTSVMIHFDHPPKEVFEYLLAEVDQYDDSIVEVTFDNSTSAEPGSRSVGSARLCTFDNGKVLVEPLLVYEPHRFYAYTVDPERSTFRLPIRDVLMFYSFEETAKGTLVTVRAHYTAKSRIASPIVGSVFNRTVRKTFARAAERFGGTLIDPSR
ncbi:MAG: SRPBCC family protein [Bacteroidota bacterium]